MTEQSQVYVNDEDFIAATYAHKGAARISVCLPCRNEEDTVGDVVKVLHEGLVANVGLIDQLIVVDDGSTDRSAQLAEGAGATVVPISEIHDRFGPGSGKGNVLWASLTVSDGDIVVWLDADVTTITPRWVAELVSPLLTNPKLGLVKASYHRSTEFGGGGRTTELVVRPVLSFFAPELCWINQPLAGEMAVRRSMVEQLELPQGWGVEIGMIIEMAERFGIESIAQAELGERQHRHRNLLDLRVQAAEVMATALMRLGHQVPDTATAVVLPDGRTLPINLSTRPRLDGFDR